MQRPLPLILALLGLAACDRAPARDVAYYAAHTRARSQRIADCSDHPQGRDPVDCRAALSANAQAESRRSTRYVRPKSRLDPAGGL